jgi:hypothetical protein
VQQQQQKKKKIIIIKQEWSSSSVVSDTTGGRQRDDNARGEDRMDNTLGEMDGAACKDSNENGGGNVVVAAALEERKPPAGDDGIEKNNRVTELQNEVEILYENRTEMIWLLKQVIKAEEKSKSKVAEDKKP